MAARGSRRGEAGSAASRGIGTKVMICVLAALMAASLLVPSLASIFSSASSSYAAPSEGAASAAAGQGTVAAVDATYEDAVAELEADLEESPDDLATLLNLGDACSAWAYNASEAATTDEELAHASELYGRAAGYYERYLALKDSDAVVVSHATALFGQGDAEGAIAELEQRAQGEGADYPPLFVTLGLLYETAGDAGRAEEAYSRAAELDPDDEYGARTTAEERLSALSGGASAG